MKIHNIEKVNHRIALLQAELRGMIFARDWLTGQANGSESGECSSENAQAKEQNKTPKSVRRKPMGMPSISGEKPGSSD